MIYIGKPYIKREVESAKLCSQIMIDEKYYEIYYEVDSTYQNFLCFERADAFVIGLLHLALERKEDIFSEAPISEQLNHQLTSYLIPTLVKYRYTKEINIIAESVPVNVSKGTAVGTGLSSGVDSFHTISTHTKLKLSKYNITHVTFLNVGSHGNGEKANHLYQKRLMNVEKISKELNLPLVVINSNISDVIDMDFIKTHTFRSFSAILALQKLFSVYYYASGYPLDEFRINKDANSANFDLLTVYAVSNENIEFYTSGIETTRLEKVKEISNYELSYKYLNVCTRNDRNCGKCEKCVRTQLELYALNKLFLYDESFDLSKFKLRLNSHIGYMLANQEKPYYREIKNTMKENNISIPTASYMYVMKYKLINILKNTRILINKVGK